MNSRIDLPNGKTVRIRLTAATSAPRIQLEVECGVLFMRVGREIGTIGWESEALSALRDCINCFEATGSFAALADTSAVPFVGKRMRRKSGGEVVYLADYATDPMRCYVRPLGGYEKPIETWMWRSDLAPLAPEPPKPRYRPYTPVEASGQLGRNCLNKVNASLFVKHVKCCPEFGWHVRLREYQTADSRIASLEKFANEWRWADTGEPCGTPEQP